MFITNHTHVLLRLAHSPDASARELGNDVGITPRQAQRIVADLVEDGYVSKERVGRRNHYLINSEHKLRHPALRTLAVGQLLALLLEAFDQTPLK